MKSEFYTNNAIAALIQSIIAVGLSHGICLFLLKADSAFSLYAYSTIPPLIFLLVSTCWLTFEKKLQVKTYGFLKTWIIQFIAVCIFSYLIDDIVCAFNRAVPHNYANLLERYIIENGRTSGEYISMFRGFPFFLQNSYANISAIVAGTLAGTLLNARRQKGTVSVTA